MGEWISVKDRLPGELSSVLIWVFGKWMIQANYFDGDWKIMDSNWIMGRHVTHWMPLPEAPHEN